MLPIAVLFGLMVALPQAAFAQNTASDADRTVQDAINLQRTQIDTRPEECRPGANVNGKIVVCADPLKNERERLPMRDQTDSALSTDDGVPRAPDVFGIRQNGGVTFKGCFLPPCPPPPMYFFDVTALPEAPPGSDADKIAKGEMAER